MQDVLNFGRSGAGAPVKDSSGKVKAVVVGNPEIRFQENEGVQKSIQNAIRYHADKDFKSQYHADLGSKWEREIDEGCREVEEFLRRHVSLPSAAAKSRFLFSLIRHIPQTNQ